MADLEKAIEEVEALVTTYADNTQYDAFRFILAANRKMRAALERIADPRNIHFAGDAQVVARSALSTKGQPDV